jgi:hypothetical protein
LLNSFPGTVPRQICYKCVFSLRARSRFPYNVPEEQDINNHHGKNQRVLSEITNKFVTERIHAVNTDIEPLADVPTTLPPVLA